MTQISAEPSGCPLCGEVKAQPGWLPPTEFAGERFTYLECARCRSLRCTPVPTEHVLGEMYGSTYLPHEGADLAGRPRAHWDHVLAALDRMQPGSFVDFGCGAGDLLELAAERGWRVTGVEFDSDVTAAVSRQTGLSVVDVPTFDTSPDIRPDVVHFGDVLEHLPDPAVRLRRVIERLAPGGWVIAHGPLEANPHFFLTVLRLKVRRRDTPTRTPPYHLVLATGAGQQLLFERVGLHTVEFSLSEVAWPAPERLTRDRLRDPRQVMLYTLRGMSRGMTAVVPRRLGNRFFYVGRRD